MAWKLKKTKLDEDESAADASAAVDATSRLNDELDFETGVGPSEADFSAHDVSEAVQPDVYAQRMVEVDEAIASITSSKKNSAGAASNGSASNDVCSAPSARDDDDWSLDAFAPYKPPQHAATNPADAKKTGLERLLDDHASEEIDFTKGAAPQVIEAAAQPAETIDALPPVLGDEPDWELNEPPTDVIAVEPTLISPPPTDVDDDRTLTHVNLSEPGMPIATAPLPPRVYASLEVHVGQFTAKYDIENDEVAIGRPDPVSGTVPTISIEWDDAISRRHASVILKDGKYCVLDLGSKNGTYLNGKALPPQVPVALTNGDTIIVGERTKITFIEP